MALPPAIPFFPKAADGLVCAHVPDREAEEEPVPEPRRAGGHPSGHPESRAAGHPGAAEDRVSQGTEQGGPQGPVYKSQEAPASHQVPPGM